MGYRRPTDGVLTEYPSATEPSASADCLCPNRTDCAFFCLPKDARTKFLALARTHHYDSGMTVVRQGDPARGVFLIRSGLVRMFYVTASGRTLAVRMAMTSGILGLTDTISGVTHGLTVETLAPTELDYVAREPFLGFLLEHPQVAVRLLKHIGKEFKQLHTELWATTDEVPLSERLLRRLKELAAICGEPVAEGVLLGLPLTVQDLADTLWCSRQWASKLLVDLEKEGLLKRQGRRFIVTYAALNGR